MGKRKVKAYTLEFKKSSAQLAATSEQSVSQTAKDLGININTLHGWVNKYCPSANLTKANFSSHDELQAELKQLKKENAQLKQERDILKKASAYFASEMS